MKCVCGCYDETHFVCKPKTLILKKEKEKLVSCRNKPRSRLLIAFYIEAGSIFILVSQLNIDCDFCLFGF